MTESTIVSESDQAEDPRPPPILRWWPMVATLVVLLGYALAGFSAYSDLKARQVAQGQYDTFLQMQIDDHKRMDVEGRAAIAAQLGEIRGDIKALLARTPQR